MLQMGCEAAVLDSHSNSMSEQGMAVGFTHASDVVQAVLSPIDPWQASPLNWPNTSMARERL